MAPNLTIRNLTSTPLELKSVERYEAPKPAAPSQTQSLLKNVTSVLGVNSTSSSGPSIAHDAQGFERNDVGFRIEPFATTPTDISASIRGGREVLRLVFEADGQRYQIDVPSSKASSSILTPLDQDPRRELTGVFDSDETYLAVYSSSNLHAWMQHLKDETPLSALSIPGTHNSPTHHTALPSVRCQARSPRDQLDNGVRFFDIRVQPETRDKDSLQLVHGVFPISLTGPKQFRDLLNDVYQFLERNPSETVMISLKREGTGNATDQDLAHILAEHYIRGNENRWFTDNIIPSLGQTRGKVILLRRFGQDDEIARMNDGRGLGIDASSWADNTPCSTAGAICVQDFYQVLETENIDKKLEFARAHLERAGDYIAPLPGITTDAQNPVPAQPFHLNFLSASNFWKPGCWPDKIAAKLNPAITKHICRDHAQNGKGDGSTGIVITDWVGENDDWDLIRCIVGMNTKLMAREQAI